jgi:hypothetical protein
MLPVLGVAGAICGHSETANPETATAVHAKYLPDRFMLAVASR